MKYFYIAVTVDYTGDPHYYGDGEGLAKGKYYSFVERVSHNDNILSRLGHIGGIKYANLCSSKKEAEELTAFWNDCFEKNGTLAI